MTDRNLDKNIALRYVDTRPAPLRDYRRERKIRKWLALLVIAATIAIVVWFLRKGM